MLIRKQYKFEGAHMVKNCSTDKCMKSIHGHSYLVDVWVTAGGLDNGHMIMDFSLFKPFVSDFIDSFDHSIALWSGDSPEYLASMKKYSARWLEMKLNPSAEGLALTFHTAIGSILNQMKFVNGEHSPRIYKVGVHETKTGYAETLPGQELDYFFIKDLKFSEDVIRGWKYQNMWADILSGRQLVNL